jgi:quinohemoprotein ethanol dehydrogenase
MQKFFVITLLAALGAQLTGCDKQLSSGGASQSTSSDNTAAASTSTHRVGEDSMLANTGWNVHGGNASETRFSELKHINQKNVGELGLAWSFDLPEPRGQEATPLIIDGVMYTTAAWNHVYALNAVTGEQLWHFDPQVPKAWGAKGCCDVVNRGVAYSDGKVITGTFDGRLIALDANTGKQLWSTLTIDPTKNYTITGAPRIANGKVFIGNGGAEFGVRGYVSAYDQNTGELVWRFYTVPGHKDKPQENAIHNKTIDSWDGEWWTIGGGGTVWDSMAYDPELNLLYIGVGNGSPWNPKLRSNGKGDNLFLSSIVALEADTGKYRWHYQTTPQTGWDYTATQHIILADLTIDGTEHKVLMQAPKNGFFYVIDRQSGKLISAENFVPVTWAKGIDKNGRPIVNPEAKYWETGKPALVSPAWLGGHSWHPMSFNQQTGLVYLPAQEMAFPYANDENYRINPRGTNLGINLGLGAFPDDPAAIAAIKKSVKGHLSAWDPVAQKEVWRVQYPGPWNGGVLSTAGGLVFQGTAGGFVNAYHASTGEKLWQFPAQTGVVAPPVTYQINGEQYVTVSVGWGGIYPLITGPLASNSKKHPINKSRVLTFKLGGKAELPAVDQTLRTMANLSDVELNKKQVAEGFELYEVRCGICHGTGAVGGGVIPDLRYSVHLQHDSWFNVVLDGALESRGMIGFGSDISKNEAAAIRAYVISRNQFANKIGDVQRLSR